ncbi:hypothetical protein [Actinacidiphila paucisporea]|uniref:hypothetical protein n=1 Tax=Actinacidiphila paucisporea TaxID=310782 RepID=UPI0011613675|nr:hypothetical protein [Actinacidiphila paucisporea]
MGMRSRMLLPALVLAALTGCGGSGTPADSAGHPTPPAAPTPAASTSAAGAGLADPLPDRLPPGTKVVLRRTGRGPQPLDLSGLVSRTDEVTLHWLCAGGADGVRVTDHAAIVVGSDCSATAGQATLAFTGVVPPSGSRDLSWKVQAGASTMWRIAVTVGT